MITLNLSNALQGMTDKIRASFNEKEHLRAVAVNVMAIMTTRIHEDGNASDNTPIGPYSKAYMAQRKKNNRSGSDKVIVSLTRQLENDWAVLATKQGWGVGFNNKLNAQKLRWVEETKSVKIGNLTSDEKETALLILLDAIHKQLSK
jgi:predicted HNH restriction endonuclease